MKKVAEPKILQDSERVFDKALKEKPGLSKEDMRQEIANWLADDENIYGGEVQKVVLQYVDELWNKKSAETAQEEVAEEAKSSFGEAPKVAKRIVAETDPLQQAWVNDALFDPDDLTWNRSTLIDQAADVVQNILCKVGGAEILQDRIWLEKIVATEVKGGNLYEGEMSWAVIFRSPIQRIAKTITFPLIIRNGKFEDPRYFMDSSNNLMPFTKAALVNYIQMGIRTGSKVVTAFQGAVVFEGKKYTIEEMRAAGVMFRSPGETVGEEIKDLTELRNTPVWYKLDAEVLDTMNKAIPNETVWLPVVATMDKRYTYPTVFMDYPPQVEALLPDVSRKETDEMLILKLRRR